mmetsp:Transcript_106703/g.211909  ORF Transcript_106703/g.211909 Transcript_106703/m.211909 type:complete len:85 (-) Transcript_106703:768-1022(-)
MTRYSREKEPNNQILPAEAFRPACQACGPASWKKMKEVYVIMVVDINMMLDHVLQAPTSGWKSRRHACIRCQAIQPWPSRDCEV